MKKSDDIKKRYLQGKDRLYQKDDLEIVVA